MPQGKKLPYNAPDRLRQMHGEKSLEQTEPAKDADHTKGLVTEGPWNDNPPVDQLGR